MSIKNTALDLTAMHVQVSNAKNRISRVILFALSIIFLIIAVISFLFSWKVGLVLLVIAAVFFGLSKLAKFATKVNEGTIEKLQGMKEPLPNEKL
ncbi:MAG: hypothetical protein ABIH49_00720 [archaeon]